MTNVLKVKSERSRNNKKKRTISKRRLVFCGKFSSYRSLDPSTVSQLNSGFCSLLFGSCRGFTLRPVYTNEARTKKRKKKAIDANSIRRRTTASPRWQQRDEKRTGRDLPRCAEIRTDRLNWLPLIEITRERLHQHACLFFPGLIS